MNLDPVFLPSPKPSSALQPAATKATPAAFMWVVTAGLLVAIVGGFAAVGVWNGYRAASGVRFSALDLRWDNAIPRTPAWAWVYVLFYPSAALPFAFRAFRQNLETFARVCAGYLLQIVVALPLFVMPIRMWRTAVEGAGASAWLLRLIYSVDAGFNVFPSMHVSYVTFLACVGGNLGGRKVGAALWVFCGLIMLSTLFTKQHYLVDLPAGFALGVATYLVAFRTNYSPFQNRTGPVSQ